MPAAPDLSPFTGSVAEEKKCLRQRARKRRALHTAPHAAEHIAARFMHLYKATVYPHIGIYWPMGTECDTRPLIALLRRQGAVLCLPAFVNTPCGMVFRAFPDESCLRPYPGNWYGPDAQQPVIQPPILALPLLAFDASGTRLGQGGGCYDRYLHAHPQAVRVGIAFEAQKFSCLPRCAHDMPLDAIVTETALYRVQRRGLR